MIILWELFKLIIKTISEIESGTLKPKKQIISESQRLLQTK